MIQITACLDEDNVCKNVCYKFPRCGTNKELFKQRCVSFIR